LPFTTTQVLHKQELHYTAHSITVTWCGDLRVRLLPSPQFCDDTDSRCHQFPSCIGQASGWCLICLYGLNGRGRWLCPHDTL